MPTETKPGAILDDIEDEGLYPRRAWRPQAPELAHLLNSLEGKADFEDIFTADLGVEYETFLASDAGRGLVERAWRERVEARDALETVDPENPKAIRALQMKAAVAKRFLSWCLESIREGENASRRMQQRDDQPHDIADH